MFDETVDEEILRKAREYWRQFEGNVTPTNYKQILSPFKKEQKSNLLLLC